jgi:hypothetical protein
MLPGGCRVASSPFLHEKIPLHPPLSKGERTDACCHVGPPSTWAPILRLWLRMTDVVLGEFLKPQLFFQIRMLLFVLRCMGQG